MAGVPFREPGWAEIFIPLQAIEVHNIHIDEPKKLIGPGIPSYAIDRPIALLSYSTSLFRMPTLGILTPFLKIHSWDSTTGKLELDITSDPIVSTKYFMIQEHILNLLSSKPQWLFPHTRSKEDLRANFQEFIHEDILTIYLHGPNPEKKQTGRVWIWRDDEWQKGAGPNSFKKGQQIRVALRFQGVCFLQTPAKKMRYRIQHQTVTIFQKQTIA
jgi:hypothetical protein